MLEYQERLRRGIGEQKPIGYGIIEQKLKQFLGRGNNGGVVFIQSPSAFMQPYSKREWNYFKNRFSKFSDIVLIIILTCQGIEILVFIFKLIIRKLRSSRLGPKISNKIRPISRKVRNFKLISKISFICKIL